MMPMMVSMILMSNISGALVSRLRMFKPIAVTGMAIAFLGIFSFGVFGKYCSIWGLIAFSSLAALAILAAEPAISGADLGLRVGKSKRWGQLFKNGLATAAPADPQAS